MGKRIRGVDTGGGSGSGGGGVCSDSGGLVTLAVAVVTHVGVVVGSGVGARGRVERMAVAVVVSR